MRALVRTAVLVTLGAIPAVALASSQVWVTNCNREQYKPSAITVACGDGNTYVAKLQWSSWSATKAAGKGDYAYNTCSPSCVAGHIKSYPVTATLSAPKRCKKEQHRDFTKLEVTFTGARPSYLHHANDSITLGCPF